MQTLPIVARRAGRGQSCTSDSPVGAACPGRLTGVRAAALAPENLCITGRRALHTAVRKTPSRFVVACGGVAFAAAKAAARRRSGRAVIRNRSPAAVERPDAALSCYRAGVTRHTALPTSSATSSAPRPSTATPTGRPRACPRVVDETGQHVLRRPGGPAVAERHEHHLVAGARPAIPRAVLADEGAAAIARGQQRTLVEREAERARRARRARSRARWPRATRSGRGGCDARVDVRRRSSCTASRRSRRRAPTSGSRARGRCRARRARSPPSTARRCAAPTPCRWDCAGPRRTRGPCAARGSTAEDRRALRLDRHPVLADVAVGADGDVELPAVGARDDVLRPVVVDACRPAGRRCVPGAAAMRSLARAIGKAQQGVGVGDVEVVADQRHAEGRMEPRQEHAARLGHAVAVGVAQQRDAIRRSARRRRPAPGAPS